MFHQWRRVGRDVGRGLGAAVAATLAMAAVATAGVALTGAGRYGSTGALAAAGVVLATGGSVDLSVTVDGLLVPVRGFGDVRLRPLGVSLAGAVAFGAALLLPLRRRRVAPDRLAVRAGAAVAGLAALAGLAGHLARGTVTARVDGAGGPAEVAFEFRTGPAGAIAAGLGWALVVLALGWLGSARSPVPAGWRRWRDPVRPVLTAALAVAVAGSALLVVVAAAAAPASADGSRLLGAALLAAPNGLVALVTIGLGGRWTLGLAGPLGERLAARLGASERHGIRLDETGGEHPALTLGRLAEAGHGWLLPVGVAAVLLLGCGVLAATRTPGLAGGGALRVAAARAGLLGGVLAVMLPALAALAGGALDAGLVVFGRGFDLIDARLHASLPLAAVLGLGGGMAAGFAGSLVVDVVDAVRGRRGAYARWR